VATTTIRDATVPGAAAVGTRAARGRRRTRRPAPWWLLVPAVVAAVVAVLPIVYLVARTGSVARLVEVVATPATVALTLRSVLLAATVTVLAVVIGVVAAWLVARTQLPGRRAWQVAMVLPLAIPSYISAFVWLEVAPGIAGFPGAVLVLTMTTFPYVFLLAVAALRRIDPAQEEVAASLGMGRWEIARRIAIPQIRTSVAAGALLVALYVLSDFGAVALMRYEVFTWVIYGAYRSGFDPIRAAVLSMLLVLLAAVLVAAEARVRGRVRARTGSGVARAGRAVALGRATAPAIAFLSAVLVVGVVVPLAAITSWLVAGVGGQDLGQFGPALAATLQLSALAAIACLALAVPVGVLAARYPGRLSAMLERTTYVGHALPGIVVAIAMVYVGVRVLRPIYQQTPLLVLAYVVLFLPLAVAAVRVSVERSPVRAEEVARSLGLDRWATLRRVTLPLAAPGLAAGAAMVFLTTMKELPATLLLHPTGTETLATMLWRFMLVSDYASAAPYAALIVVGAALPAVVLARIGRGSASDG
jgi:iron(III) transport system permease protein